MTPYYRDDWLTILEGDCREVMATMEPESVHCVVTSPPYWGLRDYGIGEKGIGLEPTPEAYVESMVAVFREVRRVLRADGTVWLNLGDSYAASGIQGPNSGLAGLADRYAPRKNPRNPNRDDVGDVPRAEKFMPPGLKPKDLVGIPWRVAFALQADGWYLRSDIIWAKPNPMPESVTDRPTKAHEYLFLLSKSSRYYYDADAVREPVLPSSVARAEAATRHVGMRRDQPKRNGRADWDEDALHFDEYTLNPAGRNLRSVWNIATQPYPGAHFATFPEKLVEPCILAGTSAKGVCPSDGTPWARQIERGELVGKDRGGNYEGREIDPLVYRNPGTPGMAYENKTTGWLPQCSHLATPIPATVLDPFAGSGTTARVAARLSRRAVLIDLNADYLGQAMKRNHDIPLGLESA